MRYKQMYVRYFFIIVAVIVGAILCNKTNLVASTSYYENWNTLTPSIGTLENASYYVKDNVEIYGKEGESGIVIKGDVSLYVAEGKTLSVNGGIGCDTNKASGAGIELDEGATLRIYGKGNIRANGANGQILADVEQREEGTLSLSFGAGAGIGGKGGILERIENDKSSTTTSILHPQTMGTLYIYDQVNIIATAGQGEDVGAGTANIGNGGNQELGTSKGTIYVARSANVSDIKGTSIQATRTSATWVEMKVINFDNQGGEGETFTYGLAQTLLHPISTIPFKEGYQFLGYYSEENGKGENYIDGLGNPTNVQWNPFSTTLYAAWRANTYTLTLSQDGVNHLSVDGRSANANGTYTLTYGTDITVRVQTSNENKFINWVRDGATTTNHSTAYSFQVPARDIQLHVVASDTKEEASDIKENNALARYASVVIQTQVDGIRKDMGVMSLVSEQGNILTPSRKDGNYTYTKTIDEDIEPYEVRIDGKRSGIYVSFNQVGTAYTTIPYHELNIHVNLNGTPSDPGEIQFINKDDPKDEFQIFYDENLGFAQYYALENKDAVYQIKVAGQWMSEEVRFFELQDLQLDLYRASLDIQLDGIAKNMGEVTLRDDEGSIKHTLYREDGKYQKIACDTNTYWIYVDGVNTEKKMPFASEEKLDYYSVSYEVTNPDVRGTMPNTQVYLAGSMVHIDTNSNLSRGHYTLLGWRNERQLFELGSEIRVDRTIQFYDTWQRNEESKQDDVRFWVDDFGFATLDEAVIATQMSNSSAFGKTTIEYRKTDTKELDEIYGTLPSGYVLKANQEQLIVPKGKTFTLGDKDRVDDADAMLIDLNLLIDEGQLNIDGLHAKFMRSKISLLPGNSIQLVSKLQEDSGLRLECLDEIEKPAIMNKSKKWKSNMLLVKSDVQKNSPMGHIVIENEGFSIVASQSEMGMKAFYTIDSDDVGAMTQHTLKDGSSIYTSYKTIQEAIDEDHNGPKEIYVLKDSEEELTLHGVDSITLISAKQQINTSDKQMIAQPDDASKILSEAIRIKDNQDGSGTLFRLQQMHITKPIQLDANSKVEVTEKKTWLSDEKLVIHTNPIKDKEKRSMVIAKPGTESHILLSNALLSQGYALYQQEQEIGMKYYGKTVEIIRQLTDITSEETSEYTLEFDVAYETGISDDESLNDAQYQELGYQWQRKLRGSTQWQDMDNTLASIKYENGIANIRYTKQADSKDREYVYRCLVYNKVSKAKNTYVTTREASIFVLEEPSEFLKIPKQIDVRQERREVIGDSEVEEFSTLSEILLVAKSNEAIQYEVYTHPTLTLSQKHSESRYTLQVCNENRDPLANDGFLMQLQAGGKEKGQFYLYGNSVGSNSVGVFKGTMTFQIQRTQK